jgi:hypothetical protein
MNTKSHADEQPLEIEEDPKLQRRTWVVQRVSWVAMGVIVVAALAGLFAVGPLASREARDPGGLLRAEYHRFERHLTPTHLRLHLSPEATSAESVTVLLGREFVDSFRILRITPEPIEMGSAREGAMLRFRVAAAQQPMSIRIDLEPARMGSISGALALAGRAPAQISQFVYP